MDDIIITKEMVKQGYKQGIVKLISPDDEDETTACLIGDCWFYFGSDDTENSSPYEYIKNHSEEDIIAEIFNTLDGFNKAIKEGWDEFEDEYFYYFYYLNEKIILS